MGPFDAGSTLRHGHGQSPRLTQWSGLVTLVSEALTFALVWAQPPRQVLHRHYLPFVILIPLRAVAAAVALGSGLGRVIRGPHRIGALTWMALASIPPGLFSFVGLYAGARWRDRRVPN